MTGNIRKRAKLVPAAAVIAAALSVAGAAQAAEDSVAFISPTAEPVSVGAAGQWPPDIARLLMVRGAQISGISPDGGKIAFTSLITGVRQIFVMPVTGGAAEQITFGNGVTFFRWAPDGSGLLYGVDNSGDEQEAYYFITADGASERLVMPAVKDGFRSFGAYSPDGSKFAYASTERNGADFDLYIADLATGAAEMVFEGKNFFAVRAWSPDGARLIVTETVGEDGNNLYAFDIAERRMDLLYKPEPYANVESGFGGGSGFAFNPDGSGLYFSTNMDREFTALGRHDFASASFTLIEENPAHDIQQPTLCGERYLLYTINENGADSLRVRDLKSNRALAAPSMPRGIVNISCAKDAPVALLQSSTYQGPGALHVWRVGERNVKTVLSPTMAGVDPGKLTAPEVVRMKARDGVELQGLLYLPQGLPAGVKPPVIFDVHGGPTGESRAGFDAVAQFHVARGVAVFKPNVRGSTGFGRTYVQLDNQEKRLDSVRDLVDMLDGLKADGRVDASRAAVKGGSYGGYMVNAVLGLYPEAFAAGVSLFGVGDWVTGLEVASPALKAADLIEYGDINDPKWRAFYTENSPIRFADRIRVPVLYSHGAMDRRIDKAETEVMVRALRANGVEAPYILFPDEGHGWRKLSNQLFYFRREAEFLAKVFATDEVGSPSGTN